MAPPRHCAGALGALVFPIARPTYPGGGPAANPISPSRPARGFFIGDLMRRDCRQRFNPHARVFELLKTPNSHGRRRVRGSGLPQYDRYPAAERRQKTHLGCVEMSARPLFRLPCRLIQTRFQAHSSQSPQQKTRQQSKCNVGGHGGVLLWCACQAELAFVGYDRCVAARL